MINYKKKKNLYFNLFYKISDLTSINKNKLTKNLIGKIWFILKSGGKVFIVINKYKYRIPKYNKKNLRNRVENNFKFNFSKKKKTI